MGAGQLLDLQVPRQRRQQFETVRGTGCQQARATDRTERHRRQQFGIVGDPGSLAGVGPAVVEHVLAVGVPLAIAGQRRDQPSLLDVQQVLGLPAGMFTQAAAVLQGAEEGVAQKRLPCGHQRIPIRGNDLGQALQTL